MLLCYIRPRLFAEVRTRSSLKSLEDPTRLCLTVSTAVCWTVLHRSHAQSLLGGSDEAAHGSKHCTWDPEMCCAVPCLLVRAARPDSQDPEGPRQALPGGVHFMLPHLPCFIALM